MKKITAFAVSLMLILSLAGLSITAGADFNDQEGATKGLRSDIYYMISLDDSTELFSKNADKKVAPAAFVKTLAAMVAIEQWGNLDEIITVTDESLALVKYEYGIRTAAMRSGESYTKRTLIDTMLIYSANDAASIIAYNISGSVEAFVKQMNDLAAKIGCTDTVIKNIHGFDEEGQYTTAADVAKILKYSLNSPVFAEAFSATSVTVPATSLNSERTYPSGNKMMTATIPDYYHSSINGGKATSTDEAGECIAVTSSQDGYSYLTVVMKGKLADVDKDGINENTSMTDARQLIDWVYDNIRFKVIATATQTVSVVNIVAGRDTDTLRLVPEKETSALVPAKAASNSVLITPVEDTVPERIVAPVSQGDVICRAKVYYADKEIATINLVAAEDVGLSVFRLFMDKIASLLSSTVFIIIEAAALIVVVTYIVLFAMKYLNGKKPQLKVVGKKDEAKNKGEVKAKEKTRKK